MKKIIVAILGIVSILLIISQIVKNTAEQNIINILNQYPEVDQIKIVYADNTTKVVSDSNLALIKPELKPDVLYKINSSKHIKSSNLLVKILFFANGKELFSEQFFDIQGDMYQDEASVIDGRNYIVIMNGFYAKLQIQDSKTAELLGL